MIKVFKVWEHKFAGASERFLEQLMRIVRRYWGNENVTMSWGYNGEDLARGFITLRIYGGSEKVDGDFKGCG